MVVSNTRVSGQRDWRFPVVFVETDRCSGGCRDGQALDAKGLVKLNWHCLFSNGLFRGDGSIGSSGIFHLEWLLGLGMLLRVYRRPFRVERGGVLGMLFRAFAR